MNCDWTEQISLLIDGELDATEARAAESHLADCAACRHAREDFLLLRSLISSYTVTTDPVAQRQVLRRILGVEDAAAREASTSGAAARGWRGLLGGAFASPRLGPALAGAFALLLVAVVIGVVVLRRAEHREVAFNPNRGADTGASVSANANNIVSANNDASAGNNAKANNSVSANANAVVAPPSSASESPSSGASASSGASRSSAAGKSRAVESGVAKSGKGSGGVRVETASAGGTRRGANLNVNARRENANARREQEARQPKIIDRLKLPVAPKLAVDSAELVETEIASLKSKIEPSDMSTSQHVEQAERLLRSFRNARVEGEPSVDDIAYEKRRSRELLYRNIVLRREAAAQHNESVASLLDSLEPILIDIANLPDKPARDDVRAITERMKKKNIVAMLQVANGSRMY